MSSLNSAHGGPGWQARRGTLRDDIGTIWAACGVSSEVGRLRRVLLHRPGPAIETITDPAAVLWDAVPDVARARAPHGRLASAYHEFGVRVPSLDAGSESPPTLHFCRDHFFMVPAGAVVSRMGSAARAGEERLAALTLARLGIPILHTVHGAG